MRAGLLVAAEPGVADRLFREESGRAVATLIRVLRDFDAAEEAVQEAFVVALERSAHRRDPGQPGRLDHPSCPQQGDRPPAAREDPGGQAPRARSARGATGPRRDRARRGAEELPDDRLRLIFTCRHPALAGGAHRAHAAHAGRADDRGDRARLPGRRVGHGPAPGAREAQDPRRPDPLRGAGARVSSASA